jgi:hypothetical protein
MSEYTTYTSGNNNKSISGNNNTIDNLTLKDMMNETSRCSNSKSSKNKNWPLLISIIAIVMSIIAICSSLKSFSLSETAYLGWTISVLSMLVVILMGWQIYKGIELQNFKNEIEERTSKAIELKIQDYNHTISAHLHNMHGLSCIYVKNNFGGEGLAHFMIAIKEVNKATDKSPLKEIIDSCFELMSGNYGIAISKEERIQYIQILSECGHEKRYELIEFILSLNVMNL